MIPGGRAATFAKAGLGTHFLRFWAFWKILGSDPKLLLRREQIQQGSHKANDERGTYEEVVGFVPGFHRRLHDHVRGYEVVGGPHGR